MTYCYLHGLTAGCLECPWPSGFPQADPAPDPEKEPDPDPEQPTHEHVLRHGILTYIRPWQWGWKKVWWLRCSGCPDNHCWGPYSSRAVAETDRDFDFAMWKARLDLDIAVYQAEARKLIEAGEQRLARLERLDERRRSKGGPLTRMARRPQGWKTR